MSNKHDSAVIVLSSVLAIVIILFIVTIIVIYRKKIKKCCKSREPHLSFQMTSTPKREDIQQNRISVFDSVYIPTTRPLSPLVKKSGKIEKGTKLRKNYENVMLMPKSLPADGLPFSVYSTCSKMGMIKPLCPIKSSYDQSLIKIRESMQVNLDQNICPMELASCVMGKSSNSLKTLDVKSLSLKHNPGGTRKINEELQYATLQHPKKSRDVTIQKDSDNIIYADIVK